MNKRQRKKIVKNALALRYTKQFHNKLLKRTKLKVLNKICKEVNKKGV